VRSKAARLREFSVLNSWTSVGVSA
jgi:hypothetical protein